jgi:cytochrome-b5 reductase
MVPLLLFGVLLLLGVGYYLATKGPKIALDATKYQKFELINKINVSHNTRKFMFKLQTPKTVLGLPVGQHMSIRAIIDGKVTMRSYTPTSSDDNLGYFALVVKVLFLCFRLCVADELFCRSTHKE